MSTPPPLQVLLPAERAGQVLEPLGGDPDLADLYAHPAPSSGRAAYVRANFVATLDGAVTGPDGRSGTINNAADLRAFRLQRAHADVVLAGAGTVRAEHYLTPTVHPSLAPARAERGQGALELAVVSASGALPEDLLAEDRPPYVLVPASCTTTDALRERIGHDRVLVAGTTTVHPVTALELLAERGLSRVLCEGGPQLMAAMVAADAVDELCLTIVPTVVGGPGPRVLSTPEWLDPARTGRLAHLLHHDGTLLGRWVLDRARR